MLNVCPFLLVGVAGAAAGFLICLFLFCMGGATHTRVRNLPTGTYVTLCQSAVTFEGKDQWAALVHCAKTQIIIYVMASRPLPPKFSVLNGKAING